jgi:hypothetical protein
VNPAPDKNLRRPTSIIVEHDFIAVPPYSRCPAFVAFDRPHIGAVLSTPDRAGLTPVT